MFTHFLTATAYAAPVLQGAPVQSGDSVMDMIITAGPMVKGVLSILLGLSVACWSVIVLKYRLVRRANRESPYIHGPFQATKELPGALPRQ